MTIERLSGVALTTFSEAFERACIDLNEGVSIATTRPTVTLAEWAARLTCMSEVFNRTLEDIIDMGEAATGEDLARFRVGAGSRVDSEAAK